MLSLILHVHSAGRTALELLEQLRLMSQTPLGQCIISGLNTDQLRSEAETCWSYHGRIVTERRIQGEASWPQEGAETRLF